MLLVSFIVIHLFWWTMAHLMLYRWIIHFWNVVEDINTKHIWRSTYREHTVPLKREKRQASCIISLFDLSTWGQTHNFKEEENYQEGVYLMKSDFEWHQYAAKEWLGWEKQRCLNKACDDCEKTEPTTGFWVWPDGPKHALTVLGMLCVMGSS